MPSMLWIETVTGKVVAVGYPLSGSNAISNLLVNKKWKELKLLIENSGCELTDLHSKKGMF